MVCQRGNMIFARCNPIPPRMRLRYRYRTTWSGCASSTWYSIRTWIWWANCCISPIGISTATGGTPTTSTLSGEHGTCRCIGGPWGKCPWVSPTLSTLSATPLLRFYETFNALPIGLKWKMQPSNGEVERCVGYKWDPSLKSVLP